MLHSVDPSPALRCCSWSFTLIPPYLIFNLWSRSARRKWWTIEVGLKTQSTHSLPIRYFHAFSKSFVDFGPSWRKLFRWAAVHILYGRSACGHDFSLRTLVRQPNFQWLWSDHCIKHTTTYSCMSLRTCSCFKSNDWSVSSINCVELYDCKHSLWMRRWWIKQGSKHIQACILSNAGQSAFLSTVALYPEYSTASWFRAANSKLHFSLWPWQDLISDVAGLPH